MLICKWEKLPCFLQIDEVKPYWEILRKKNFYFAFKRINEILFSLLALILLLPLFILISLLIKIDSPGPVFYRQIRITQYGKPFKIHKFRSMVINCDKTSSNITCENDRRVTKVGKIIRKYKIDELSQLIDVLLGKMSFVGTRPEVKEYVELYNSNYLATLLLPAGITSLASIKYKNESEMISDSCDIREVYISEILPAKMAYNLNDLKNTNMIHDLKILFITFFCLIKK